MMERKLMTKHSPQTVINNKPIPAIAGVGLKSDHYQDVLKLSPKPLWFEVHTENYMSDGGPHLKILEKIREDYPLSFHGVSLSIGTMGPLNKKILERTKKLINRYQPALVSEHLSWSSIDNTYFNDLLPLPYTEETLEHVINHIDMAQEFLGRQILIENPSTYLQFIDSVIPEQEFLTEVARRSGCGLLIDVNNLFVNAQNHQIDEVEWLKHIPMDYVKEIHLAGHHVKHINDQKILLDDHGSHVSSKVWDIYQLALEIFGPTPSLIEWDTRIPSFGTLMNEASKANLYLEKYKLSEAAHA